MRHERIARTKAACVVGGRDIRCNETPENKDSTKEGPTPKRIWRTQNFAWVVVFFIGCGSRGEADSLESGAATHKHSEHGTGPTASKTFTGTPPINVVCTTGMVAEIVKKVGGNHLSVTQLMKPGVDPHLFHATPPDVIALKTSDIIFYSGLHLEGKMVDLFERTAKKKTTFAVASQLDPQRLLKVEEGYYDPHIWFDVALWSDCVPAVADILATYDPPHATQYKQNAKAYQNKLLALDGFCRAEIAKISQQQRVLVTAHDAFHYFGRAYDLEVEAIQGISTDAEAGVKRINELVRFIIDHKIKAIFFESSISNDNVRSLIEGCAAVGHEVVIGGELFSDAMGNQGTPEGTFEGMVRHNIRTITEALK